MARISTGKTFTDDSLAAVVADTTAKGQTALTQSVRADDAADRIDAVEDSATLHAQSIAPFTDPRDNIVYTNGAKGYASVASGHAAAAGVQRAQAETARAGAEAAEVEGEAHAAAAGASENISAAIAGALSVDYQTDIYGKAVVSVSSWDALGQRTGALGSLATVGEYAPGLRAGNGQMVYQTLTSTGLGARPLEDGGTIRHAPAADGWWERIGRDTSDWYPEWFGGARTAADDATGTDARGALQAAFDASAEAGAVLVLRGRYGLRVPVDATPTLLTVPDGLTLRMQGRGASFVVLPGTGGERRGYGEVLGAPAGVTGANLGGIEIDCNAAFNSPDYASGIDWDVNNLQRAAIRFRDATRCTLSGIVVRGWDGIHAVNLTWSTPGAGQHPGSVGNVWEGGRVYVAPMPADPSVIHDLSAVYITGGDGALTTSDVEVINASRGNGKSMIFDPALNGGAGGYKSFTMCAFELHGGGTFSGLRSTDMSLGFWLVSSEDASYADRGRLLRPIITGCHSGIRVLPISMANRPDRTFGAFEQNYGSNYAMVDWEIVRPDVTIDTMAWWLPNMEMTGESLLAGVTINQGATASLRSLTVTEPTVRFLQVTDPDALANATWTGVGAITPSFNALGKVNDLVTITDPVVIDSPGTGVQFQTLVRDLKLIRPRVVDHRFLSGYAYVGRGNFNVGGIDLRGVILEGLIESPLVRNAATAQHRGIYCLLSGARNVRITGAEWLNSAGELQDNPVFVEPEFGAPYIEVRQAGYNTPPGPCAYGSQIVSTGGLVYRQVGAPFGTAWEFADAGRAAGVADLAGGATLAQVVTAVNAMLATERAARVRSY